MALMHWLVHTWTGNGVLITLWSTFLFLVWTLCVMAARASEEVSR